MFTCRLCGLTVNEIPEDAIQIGKLYRFVDGSFHFLRKKLEPRTGPRPRKSTNPCSEAPPMGTNAREVPDPPTKQKKERTEKKEIQPVPTETLMERAFRLART
jgi:hypothetical protein